MFEGLGMPHLIVLLVIVLVIFGPGKLPGIGSALGKSIRNFKSAMSAPSSVEDKTAQDDLGDKGRKE